MMVVSFGRLFSMTSTAIPYSFRPVVTSVDSLQITDTTPAWRAMVPVWPLALMMTVPVWASKASILVFGALVMIVMSCAREAMVSNGQPAAAMRRKVNARIVIFVKQFEWEMA